MSRAYKIVILWILPLLLVAIAGGFALLKAQGDQLLGVQTGSMEPTIRRGHLIGVSEVKDDQLRVGDIITYKSPLESLKGATITHRIIELPDASNGQKFVTKGDANPSSDEPFSGDKIVGRVDRSIPYAGFALDFLSTPFGLILIIYVPALFIVIDEIKRLAKHYEGQKPWRDIAHRRFRSPNVEVFAGMLIVASILAHSGFTLAALQGTATLHSSTIQARRQTAPPTNPCPAGNSNSSNISIQSNGSSSSTTNINSTISTNQTAASGNVANSGNATSDSAASGAATSCNSTSITVQVSN